MTGVLFHDMVATSRRGMGGDVRLDGATTGVAFARPLDVEPGASRPSFVAGGPVNHPAVDGPELEEAR